MSETKVADVMDADPVTVSPDDDVRTVVERLQDNELPGLPVVDKQGSVVGIVTENDLTLEEEQANIPLPHFINLLGGVIFIEPLAGFEKRLAKAFASKVSDMMTTDVDTISPDAGTSEAGRIIAEKHHNRLPVVRDGRLVGVITRVDVLRSLTNSQ